MYFLNYGKTIFGLKIIENFDTKGGDNGFGRIEL